MNTETFKVMVLQSDWSTENIQETVKNPNQPNNETTNPPPSHQSQTFQG